MKRKRFAAAALAGVMLLCAGCGQEEEAEEEAPSGTAVEVMEVTSGPMSAEYSLTGKVVAVSEVQVFPLLAGQVQTLSVEEGDTVSRGQTLFTVDTAPLRPRPTARSNPHSWVSSRRSWAWSRRSRQWTMPRRCSRSARLPNRT